MEVLYPRCAGLDVHAGSVTACVRIATGATVTYVHRTVSTTTRGLLELADWLTGHACTHVAMEATGVYWKPVWHVLEGHFTLVLANAMHIRNVPGPQERHERRDVDRRPVGARPDPEQFRAPGADPGPARPDPDAKATGRARSPAIPCGFRRPSRTRT